MTEQQIDAELCRYEPIRASGVRGTYSWWLRDERFPAVPGDKSDLPEPYFARLAAGQEFAENTRYYHTREAAFADLRQAIASSNLQPEE